jgi:hypothetical protein
MEQARWQQECEEDFASPAKLRAAKIAELQEKLAVLQSASAESRSASPDPGSKVGGGGGGAA